VPASLKRELEEDATAPGAEGAVVSVGVTWESGEEKGDFAMLVSGAKRYFE
jgi:hypothetical protein